MSFWNSELSGLLRKRICNRVLLAGHMPETNLDSLYLLIGESGIEL